MCLLGVLTLIISWGSLGLELAVAAVSVTMATSQSSLALQWCNPFSRCSSECLQRGCYCILTCCVCLPSLTVSQRLLRFPGYLRHQSNQGKRCHQPRYADKKIKSQWSGSSHFYGFSFMVLGLWIVKTKPCLHANTHKHTLLCCRKTTNLIIYD